MTTSLVRLLQDANNQIVFSTASVWEIAIKHSAGKSDFPYPAQSIRTQLLKAGYEELPVLGEHALAVESLPAIHKDPFDRLLIAQAMVEGITLLTADATIARYPGPIRKV
jgi:PIN domain nuclease of toxin-antitoxin system